MKRRSRILLFLLIAVFPITLFAQNPTTVAAFMKVKPGQGAAYLEVEQAWKTIHEKGIELGLYNGWQLWAKLHVGTEDPYQYITLQWYDDYAHYFKQAPAGWRLEVYPQEEFIALNEKTTASRDYVHETVSSLVAVAQGQGEVNFLVVNRMKVKPGMGSEYVNMETEIFKPAFERLINEGKLSYWGFWNTWPYAEGESTYTTVEGYATVEQLAGALNMTADDYSFDMTAEEIMELVQKTRDMVSSEVWVLVDQVMAEEE